VYALTEGIPEPIF